MDRGPEQVGDTLRKLVASGQLPPDVTAAIRRGIYPDVRVAPCQKWVAA